MILRRSFATLSAFSALAALVGCGAAAARPVDAPAPPAPWRSSADDGTDEGRLRARLEESAHTMMASYDAMMAGRAPVYRAFATIAGRRFGPAYGVVREDEVDGARFRRIDLRGDELTVFMMPATKRQEGAFLFVQGHRTVHCTDCFDLDARAIPFAPDLAYAPRRMELELDATRGEIVRGHVVAGVELHQLPPSSIGLSLAKTLDPMLGQAKEDGDSLVVPILADVWAPIARPPSVDAAHASCEITVPPGAAVVIDGKHLASWQLRVPAGSPTRTCCERPPMHGPMGCAPMPNDCVGVP